MAKQRRGKRSPSRKPIDRDNRYRDEARECQTGEKGKMSSLNDISWYSRNPNLLQAAGSFPFPYRPGMNLPIFNPVAQGASFTSADNYADTGIPGIMVLSWIPNFGNSSTSLDPASIAGQEMYARVRAAYSGSLDADAPDYIVYIGALDSVFTYLGWLKRVYRTISTYTPENFYLPNGIMAAMEFPVWAVAQLRQDKTRLWQGINELILMSRKFKCPAIMDLFNRHYWMSDNIYADESAQSAQFYMFNLSGVYKCQLQKEDSSEEQVMGLQMVPIPVMPASAPAGDDHYVVDTLVSFGQDIIRAIDSWDDGYTISGYLGRAYDGVPSFAVAELLQDELLTAQFVPEVLTQIENSRTVLPYGATLKFTGGNNPFSGFAVTQNVATNAVVSKTIIAATKQNEDEVAQLYKAFANGPQPVLSLRSLQPTVADSVIASRLIGISDSVTIAGNNVIVNSVTAGTEVPLVWRVVYTNNGGVNYRHAHVWTITPIALVNPAESSSPSGGTFYTARDLAGLFMMPQFDWHPFTYVAYTDTDQKIRLFINGDSHNITTITKEALVNLHRICFFSEFNSFNT